MVYIKNNDTVSHTWSGQQIDPTQYYLIQDVELNRWQSNSQLLVDISSSTAIVARDDSGSNDITDVNEAIDHLKGTGIKITQSTPFADKAQLFYRGQGVSQTITANSTESIKFTIPYIKVKLNGIEILYGNKGDTCNFKVLDSTTGTYTTVPDYLLNQFGFNWNVEENCQKEMLPYDADVFQGMQLCVEYTNNTGQDSLIGINFYIHEDKS